VTGQREQRAVKTLAIVAIGLAVLAPIAGSPYASAHASIDVAELARVVSHEEDHVTALELAQWIRGRYDGLRVVDVRDSAAYAEYHIPSAERLDLDSLVKATFQANETIVLYSDGGAHAAQGWTLLRALGYRRVFFLRGGLNEWLETVITPALPEHPATSEARDIDSIAALSRYFGGTPRRGAVNPIESAVPLPNTRIAPESKDGGSSSAIIARMRKRGC
jgi:rhodanese-related sulfurtransferase